MKALLIGIILVWSSAAWAKKKSAPAAEALPDMVPVLPEQQTAFIVFASEEDHSKDPALVKSWKEFCEKLGKGLSSSHSTPGFLASYSCLPLGVTAAPSKAPTWRIQIAEQKRMFEVEISTHDKATGYVKIRSFNFRFESNLISSLKGEVVPIAIARLIAEGLPLGWVYTHNASQPPSFKIPKDFPKFPANLIVYDLSYETKRKIWVPQVRAILKQTESKPEEAKVRVENYQIAQTLLPLRDKQRYWVQNAEGLNKRQADYEKLLSANMKGLSLLSLLDKLLFDSLDSNYAGFRYGMSFLDGNSIVTETDLLSILVEMRSGLFNGLRWYYDMSPEKKRGIGEDSEFFRMSRISLGWAFNFDMPAPLSLLVSRVEVQPKIGLLDIETKFSILDEAGLPISLAFDAKNAYDLAIEFGVEKEALWFRTRLWTSFSAAMFGVSNKTKTSVVSSKAGLDAYLDVIEWGNNWDINLLTFAIAERLNLSKEGGQIEEDAEVGISEVTFNLFFVGAGFTLSW